MTAEVAQDIQIAVGNAGTLVGLFVDPTVDQVQAVLDRIDLDVCSSMVRKAVHSASNLGALT